MARDDGRAEGFDVYTVVVLRRPEGAPEFPEAYLDELQERHLEYRAELWRLGLVVANGPFAEQSDPSYRGMSIFACDPEEAARLSAGDPSVQAGRLTFDVMEWWVGAGALGFPRADRQVGERRQLPEG